MKQWERLSAGERARMRLGGEGAAIAYFKLGQAGFETVVGTLATASDPDAVKPQVLEAAEDVYQLYGAAIGIGHPEWATAALVGIGALYEQLSGTFSSGPDLGRLSASSGASWRFSHPAAGATEEKAVVAYEDALSIAHGEAWYGEHARKAVERLTKLRPREYRPSSEMRAESGVLGDGMSREGFVTEPPEE